MFWIVKRRAFTFTFLSYISFVYSDKAVNVGNPVAGGLSGGLVNGLTSGFTNTVHHPGAGGGLNMQTCQSAGCSSYKNITHNDSGDCLNGFICKKCKRTHAKNPSICFYSSLQGYENLYEAHLEDFTQATPYDNFNIPLDNSSGVQKNRKEESTHSDKETTSSGKSGSNERDSYLEGEDDDGEKGKLQSLDKSDKTGRNRYMKEEDDNDEEESDVEEDDQTDEEDEDDEKGKRGGSKGGNFSQEKKKGTSNFHADSEVESFLQKSPDHVHKKVKLHNLAEKGRREKSSKSRPKKMQDDFSSLLETHMHLRNKEVKHNSGMFEFASSSASLERASPNAYSFPYDYYSFAQSKNSKEKIVYKRLKINLNKHEKYFKSKLNKCYVGEDGIATLYVKVLLQIVKDKNDIYVDVSRRSASSNIAPASGGQRGNGGNKTKGVSQSGEEDDNDDEEDSEESESDEYMRMSRGAKSGGGYNYSSDTETDGTVNKYAYVEVHNVQMNGGEDEQMNKRTKEQMNRGTDQQTNEPQSFYQVNEDMDGDSMGNYYKSRSGFFKSIFNRVFKKKGDSDDDTGGEDEETDEESHGKKKRRWKFPWKRRSGKNKQLQGGDEEDDESEDESRSSRRSSGRKRRFFGRSNREEDNNDDNQEDDEEEDEESTGRKGKGNDKGKDNKQGKGGKGGIYNRNSSKVATLFTKIKRKIIPIKQKLHIEAFFNSIIVKSCRNALKWEGNMFRKQSLVEMTVKVPVKMKYIQKEPLHFFRSGYEVILTCRNCEEVLFNSCVQVYCTKTPSKAEQVVEHHNGHATGGAVGNASSVGTGVVATGALAAGALAAGALATGTVAKGTTSESSHLYSSSPSDFSPIFMFDYNGQHFPGNVNTQTDDYSGEVHVYISYTVILATVMLVLLV
ncbi:conserved Plasmodium protein, unknown function [Plasmodium knowlesi strain H]|uniref:Surface-related antigen SRA n=3 Tax=Plasmodium knowlesi TaxID=5850 RepID=A0A5K1V5S2_PLAKH|nr:surface-related antigen SRA, putative [Plasmodium knowlesi strain H]OTN67719.1 Uncharacterized protein PKNOH_S05371900 [Plasmodium knowlesi]CAA9990309.1 surface-related antigen SRA, putative [Plasmodium knowlesi strain H]SBO19515.1 conserved Plasmodium protein, unknown function [Plasmodium knowlesi strain H]SBO22807.1 conserved Plasmodium protein, unknown function [Plasmodium knowlesi strain H]VVS79783.1 surface-related antigen SRA, putative [Plasmodium knowlesi strain H]|eukprot:XP_002260709.1 hypothetical protein, conserved in Plasmodium species [Plasmodium knowlesi strain H]